MPYDLNNLTTSSYKSIRDQIKDMDLFFCSGRYTASEIIKHVTKSPFSHVAAVFTIENRVIVAESVEDDGVRMVPLSHYLYDYENSGKPYMGSLYLARLKPEPAQGGIHSVLGRALDLLNKKYDKDEMMKIMGRLILGTPRYETDDEYVCSEFVDTCLTQIGIGFSKQEGLGLVTPESIAKDTRVEFVCQIGR